MLPPAAFRFRRGTFADLPYCAQMLPPGTRLDGIPIGRLVKLWERLLGSDASTLTVVDDLEKQYPENIEGFGISIFVKHNFALEVYADPQPHLSTLIYRRILAGNEIALRSDELAAVNWTTGIDVVTLHFGLRNPDLSDPRTLHVLAAGSAGFYFFHTGYRINSMSNEVYGTQPARFMESGGFRLVKDWQKEQPERFRDVPAEHHPYLFMVRRDWMEPGAINPMSQLFAPPEPVIGFSAIERRMLECALLNEPDADIAADLDVSMATVKKRWTIIFERVGRRASFVIPIAQTGLDGQRGPEKRRHLLDYLRSHLEELRPGRPRDARINRSNVRTLRRRASLGTSSF